MTRQDDATACRKVVATGSYAGKQGFDYLAGISREATGSTGLCMHLLTVPPGGRARAHLHEAHETAIYVIEGEAEMLYGDGLQHHMTIGAGEMLYIPAGVPHLPFNRSAAPVVSVIARTDPAEQESVVLLPELEAAADAWIDRTGGMSAAQKGDV